MVVGLARILCVDDEEFWRTLVKERLQDHHVDAVDSLPAAIALLDSKPAYDVALVDLNLEAHSAAQGGDLLELLRRRYPATKRIVFTGSLPGGGVRRKIFEQYDVEELIMKKDFELPDLRRAVEEAIEAGTGELPQWMRLNRSTARQRFRDWHRLVAIRLREERRDAEARLADASTASPQSLQLGQQAVARARNTEGRFRERYAELRTVFDDINTQEDLNTALDALERAEEEFGDDELGDDA
jgi:CheY-like chemotaxis protein